MTTPETETRRVVLASRRTAGILLLLVWARETNSVAVVVRDDSTDHEFVRPRVWARLARSCFARGASVLRPRAV
jgi:hypothetical protein